MRFTSRRSTLTNGRSQASPSTEGHGAGAAPSLGDESACNSPPGRLSEAAGKRLRASAVANGEVQASPVHTHRVSIWHPVLMQARLTVCSCTVHSRRPWERHSAAASSAVATNVLMHVFGRVWLWGVSPFQLHTDVQGVVPPQQRIDPGPVSGMQRRACGSLTGTRTCHMDRASVGQLTQSRSSTEVRTATAAERSSRRARREERMRRRGAAQIRLEEEVSILWAFTPRARAVREEGA